MNGTSLKRLGVINTTELHDVEQFVPSNSYRCKKSAFQYTFVLKLHYAGTLFEGNETFYPTKVVLTIR